MLPVKLTLEGVYSYRERQTIDFRSLTGGGLFGIFGPVGSGKSAILEAVTYALYGQIERLGKNDQRGYNMMNLQSEKMFIDFEFTHEGGLYRFTASAKRQRKNFDAISPPERQGYVWDQEEWRPLDDGKIRGGSSAQTILGLSYEHFRRTVIIPQGKFQEFIQLTPAHRTKMMESLFHLERFNLYGRTAALLGAAKAERARQEGRMQELGKFRREDLERLEEEAARMAEQLRKNQRELEESAEALKQAEETLRLRKEQEDASLRQKTLLAREGALEERRELREQYKQVRSRFQSLLEGRRSALEDLRRKEAAEKGAQAEAEGLRAALAQSEPRWRALREEWEGKEALLCRLRSYEACCEIAQLQDRLRRRERERSELARHLQTRREGVESKEKEREALQEQIQALAASQPDWGEMDRIQEWYRGQREILRKERSLEEEAAALKEEEEAIRQSLLQNLPPEHSVSDPEESFRELLEETRAEEARREERLREERVHLETEKKLLGLSEDLEEGEPCPLCGSPRHPAPLSVGELSAKESRQVREGEALAEHRRTRTLLERIWNAYAAGKEALLVRRNGRDQRVRETAEEKAVHGALFLWPDFSPEGEEEFSARHKEARGRDAQLREAYAQQNRSARELSQLRRETEELSAREREMDLEREKWTAAAETWEAQLTEEHRAAPPEDPRRAAEVLGRQLERLEADFPALQREREEQENARGEAEKALSAQKALLAEARQRARKGEEVLDEALKEEGFREARQVEEILSRSWDIPREEAEWERFQEEKAVLADRIAQLTEQLRSRPYDEERHRRSKERALSLERDRTALQTASGAVQKELADLRTGLTGKEALAKELDATLAREENLKELSALFKGDRFTEYIAAIHLQELCRRANERFFPLTGQTLELLFEDNAILVRDHLNEGKPRSVKTLSGGQTFQAALSLALALADQIGMGKEHFFFLDEGFGTLDRETLETVMATLRTISRDGRTIGLISHVEELRQDLDVWLQIRRTPSRGSRITDSWTGEEG